MTDFAEKAAEARGFSVVFDACAEAFLDEPDEAIIDDVRKVAAALGQDGFDFATDDDLKQRYYDRLFVTSTPYYVPLIESSIARGGEDEDGVMRYASIQSDLTDHVLRCSIPIRWRPSWRSSHSAKSARRNAGSLLTRRRRSIGRSLPPSSASSTPAVGWARPPTASPGPTRTSTRTHARLPPQPPKRCWRKPNKRMRKRDSHFFSFREHEKGRLRDFAGGLRFAG